VILEFGKDRGLTKLATEQIEGQGSLLKIYQAKVEELNAEIRKLRDTQGAISGLVFRINQATDELKKIRIG
jgi:cell division protein FtsB